MPILHSYSISKATCIKLNRFAKACPCDEERGSHNDRGWRPPQSQEDDALSAREQQSGLFWHLL